MEVEESSDKQCNNSGIDVDSGIENMEVEESDRKDSIPRSRVSFFLYWKNNVYVQTVGTFLKTLRIYLS